MAKTAKRIIAYLNHRFVRWRRRYFSPPIVRVRNEGTLRNIAAYVGKNVRRAAWIIVLGLGAEIVVLLVYSTEKTRLETALLILCNAAILAGVLGEDHFAHLSGDVALRQQEVADGAIQKEVFRVVKLIVEEVSRNAAPRQLDFPKFQELIKYGPAGEVEILYVRESTDCFLLAVCIMTALKNAQWKIVKYGPLEQPTGEKAHLPAAMAVGGLAHGVTIVGKPPLEWVDLKKPFAALHWALVGGIGGRSGVMGQTDDNLPEGLFRIIVAPRP